MPRPLPRLTCLLARPLAHLLGHAPGRPRRLPLWGLALTACLALAACEIESSKSLQTAAKKLTDEKDHRGAVIQYKAALQKQPGSAEIRFLLGKALLDSGDPANASLELSKALDQKYNPELVVPLLARAMVLNGESRKLTALYGQMQLQDRTAQAALKSSVATAWGILGERERTEAAVAEALEAKPDFGPAVILQARLQAGQGQYDKALSTVETLLARDSSLHEAWHLKGEVLLNIKNDGKGAEAAFRKALEAEKAYAFSHSSLIQMRLRERDFPGAKAQAAQMRSVLPRHVLTVFMEGQIAFYERDFPRAREAMQLLLKGVPDNVSVLQFAGAIEGQSGSLVMAQNYFSRALQLNPDLPLARRNLAQAYLRMGQPEKALEALAPMTGSNASSPDALALAGEAQLQLGDLKAAEQSFLRAATLAPDNLRVRTALALSSLARGDETTAFAELEVLSAKDKESFVDMALISVRLKRREYDLALRLAQNMAQKQPDSASVAHVVGRVQFARRDYPAARRAYEEALKLDPKLFAATISLSALDLIEKNPLQAQTRLQAAILADPRNHVARLALVDVRLNQGAGEDEITRLLTETVKASPSEADPRLSLIERSSRSGRMKEALAYAQDATIALPNDLRVLDLLGRMQSETGDQQQAVTTFRRLISLDTKSALGYSRLADVYRRAGDASAAEASLKKALDIQPDLFQAQASLMDLMLTTNRSGEALEVARRMQQRRPNEPTGYMFEGAMHQRNKAPDAAIAAYRNGMVKSGSSEVAVVLHKMLVNLGRDAEADLMAAEWSKKRPKDAVFDYQLALTAVKRKDLDNAELRFRSVLKDNPGHALALNNLAWVLTVRNKPGAVEFARRAVEILPNQPGLMDTLAMALLAEKQAPEALELQKKAVAMSPNDTALRLNLAKIAAGAGDKVLAKKELTALEAVGTALPFRAEVLKLLQTL